MVVSEEASSECLVVMDVEPAAASAAELLIAKREITDSPKRCRSVSARSVLEPVDEEPSNLTDVKQKTVTVDRGVGPTPVPPNIGDLAGIPLDNKRAFAPPHPSFLSAGSPLDQSVAYHQSLAYYYAAAQVAGFSPLGFSSSSPVGQPLSTNTHEGRYFFNHGFHHASPSRMVGSPTQSDISLFSNPAMANSMDRLAAQMHWDRSQRHLQQIHSPFNFGDSSKKSIISGDIPATPGSGSITLPPSLTSSRLTSPRPSVVGKGRKRALSHSPLSEFLDIQSLTRSSEGSLHLTPLLHNQNSRSSSAASGSYGHLSAGSLASLTPTLKSTSPFFHAATALYPGLQLPFHVPPFQAPPSLHLTPPSMAQQQMMLKQKPSAAQVKQENCGRNDKGGGSAVVSSTVHNVEDHHHIAAKADLDEEPHDFKETVCKWEECTHQFSQHQDLVKHVNQDHISNNRKTFICRWRDCCRQEKPFKAQYMLVVHMRRHTGEKPHKCQGFPGCTKAYSRLENLKTHMRSHTGERPYLCEFPGCQKAFSNASDRAKHQNRTHSNEKPYACEIDGCSKRYTDPSSLRKHVKTVHGAEFYARKKHKGLDTPGCKTNSNTSNKSEKRRGEDKMGGVEECLTVTGLVSGDRRPSQDNIPIGDQQGSPQSDIDVEINVIKEENIELDVTSNPLSTLQEAEFEEDSVYAEREDEGQSALVTRGIQRNNTRNLKSKLIGKSTTSITSLPSLPTALGAHKNKLSSSRDVPSLGNSITSIKSRKLPEIIEPSQNKIPYSAPRRDSNTSTLSSYMSSLRSDASTALFNSSRFSSRRSSEVSQNSARLSIINSPYEYDMAGNLPERSMKELNSMTDQMEKARLGSQPNLFVQSQPMSLASPNGRRGDRLRRDLTDSYRRRETEGWRTATPAHTPLPHEYPEYERRRASDPVRCADPSFTELKKLQQRFYSLNTMKPLPIPQNMKSLKGKHCSRETFQSSQSSIATNGYDVTGPDFETNLNMKMIEDNEDVIIPDDMRHFLQQRQNENLQHQNRIINSIELQRNGSTPAVHNMNGSVDEWVQQTNSLNHQHRHENNAAQPQNRQLADSSGYHCNGSLPFGNPTQHGMVYDGHPQQHNYCNTGYANMEACYGGPQHPCYAPYQLHPNYQPQPPMCHGARSHLPSHSHPINGCNHHPPNSVCNQQCLMPPPPSNPMAQPNTGLLQVRTGHVDHQMRYGVNPQNGYPQGVAFEQHAVEAARQQQMIANQQLSPPCEVTSSTDRHQVAVRNVHLNENILDNISSISTELLDQASQNFSSVSQFRPPPADSASNMVINNMSSILSQFEDENKYLNSQT